MHPIDRQLGTNQPRPAAMTSSPLAGRLRDVHLKRPTSLARLAPFTDNGTRASGLPIASTDGGRRYPQDKSSRRRSMTTTTEQHPNAAAALDLETEHTPAPQSAAREPAAPGAAGHDGQAAKGGAARKWGAEDEIAACIAWPIRNGKAKPVHELVERLARDLSDARCADAVWRWAIVS